MPFPHPLGNERSPSLWIETAGTTSHGPVDADQRADVIVVGAGIAGLTSSYLLAKAGKSVVLVDRERVAMSETGHTTAHLQIVVDTRLQDLVDRFGLEGAKKGWDSQLEAVRLIEQIAREERIACGLERLPAYLYSPREEDVDALRREMRLARRIGYAAEWADPREVPFPAKAAVRFPHQGKLHPRQYALGLAKACERLGVRIFEGTEATKVHEGSPVVVETREGHRLTGDWFVSAANTPWHVKIALHTKLHPYRTYAIGARVPRGIFGDALYWDTLDPYHYTRVEREGDRDLVVLGGEDHELAEEPDTERHWESLLDHLRQAVDDVEPAYRWSGEVMETEDGYPYIGRVPGRPENELVVTGDSGTGITNGTLGGLMVAERILGRGTPWDELYDPARVATGAEAAKGWLAKNLGDAKELAVRYLKPGEIEGPDELAPGQGGILRRGAQRIALARTLDGALVARSAACTHAGCVVGWNHAEQSWDCPCHGGRFTPGGDILHGPPAAPLKEVDLDEVLSKKEAEGKKG